MDYKHTHKSDIRILIDRHKEILEEIHKLQIEGQAIEHILLDLHNFEKPTGISIDDEIERLQKIKEQENKMSGR